MHTDRWTQLCNIYLHALGGRVGGGGGRERGMRCYKRLHDIIQLTTTTIPLQTSEEFRKEVLRCTYSCRDADYAEHM